MKWWGVPCLISDKSVLSALAHIPTPRVHWKSSGGIRLEMSSTHSPAKAHLRMQDQRFYSYRKCSARPSTACRHERASQASQTHKHYARFLSSLIHHLKSLSGASFRCFCFGRWMLSKIYQEAVKRNSNFQLHFWWTIPILFCYQRSILQTNRKIPTQSYSHK